MIDKINYGKIYIQDEDGEYKELGTTTELKFESSKYNCDFIKEVNGCSYVIPIYKNWYKKKKGKHYVWYYKIKQGVDPKMIKCLIGGKR